MNVPWSEYWAFLDAVVDIETADGLRQFEIYLRRRLRELIDRREAEMQRQERLQNTSICQLMQLLNLSDSSQMHSSEPHSANVQDNGVLPEVRDTVCTTWPPSLARLVPPDGADAELVETSPSKAADILPNGVPDVDQSDVSQNIDKPSDSLSSCSSDSFHTADNDSDLEFDLVSDWPDGLDWQAAEPLFIYG